ncbi:hypothetical protein Tco_0751591 [Tanacetum coccineum]|uniref:Uncharacterized protein n=1 Tax=Tanacetum coccineum TaxID=301880 RepID=A0ABQ4Z4N1_9ASTR
MTAGEFPTSGVLPRRVQVANLDWHGGHAVVNINKTDRPSSQTTELKLTHLLVLLEIMGLAFQEVTERCSSDEQSLHVPLLLPSFPES